MDVTSMVDKYGIQIALIIYFVYKDWTFTSQITSLLSKIEVYMSGGGSQ